ncbi:hypothetical protein ACN28C_25185 [Plantactinospora sp. WMMC1484]|uniref:hypothetical protein n=1 Tax=Plantactinospora sp. WMMC1484 TaxID=3404122 RepID=UPI003BF51A76
MSIRAYAARLGVAVATVSNWDRRGEGARLNTETQQLLDIDLDRASDDVRERFEAILAGEADAVNRRHFLSAGGVVMVGALASATVSATEGGGAAPPLSDMADVATLLRRTILAPTPGTGIEHLSAACLADTAAKAWLLRQQAQYDALGALLSDLIPRAEAGAAELSGEDAWQAGAAMVHAYNAASSLLKRLGDDSLAVIAADRAARAARRLDEPALIAAAQYRLANVFLAGRRPDQAYDVALAAADLVDPGRSHAKRNIATWGGLLLTAAVAAARKSDQSRAWELLGSARAAGRLLGEDHADMYAIFGPTNVAIHGVQVAVEIGDGKEAIRRSQCVNPTGLPASLVERRSQFLIDLAHANLLTGDAIAATAALVNAERVAPQEVRLSLDAHEIVRRLLGYPGGGRGSELRALANRIGFDGRGVQ